MSTPSTDALKQEIDAGRMRVGNQVQLSTGLPAVTTLSQNYIDSNSQLQTAEAVTVNQSTSTVELFDLRGRGTSATLTQTFVKGSDVTTATIGGYIRVKITDAGSAITSSSYYLPVYTIV